MDAQYVDRYGNPRGTWAVGGGRVLNEFCDHVAGLHGHTVYDLRGVWP